jgi:hypothetical protein
MTESSAFFAQLGLAPLGKDIIDSTHGRLPEQLVPWTFDERKLRNRLLKVVLEVEDHEEGHREDPPPTIFTGRHTYEICSKNMQQRLTMLQEYLHALHEEGQLPQDYLRLLPSGHQDVALIAIRQEIANLSDDTNL